MGDVEGHYNLGITISPTPMDVLLDEVSGRVYYEKKTALPTPGSDGATEPHHTSPEGIIPQKSYVRFLVIGGVVVFTIAAIIICVCLVPGPLSNATLTPSYSTLTPSNSTKDPLVTLYIPYIYPTFGYCNFTRSHGRLVRRSNWKNLLWTKYRSPHSPHSRI